MCQRMRLSGVLAKGLVRARAMSARESAVLPRRQAAMRARRAARARVGLSQCMLFTPCCDGFDGIH